jgi:hypothetical protein
MVIVVFQNTFHSKIYQNNFFKEKLIFDIRTSKQFKNIKKLILSKKNSKFN